MTGKTTEPPLFIDMDFGEALRRYAQTKPEELQPPSGRKRKTVKCTAEKPPPKT